jgi:hypothetical protein
MPRNLRQYMKIDRNVLEKKEMDHVVKIVQSEEEFNEICRQNPEIENINFHIESKIVFFGANSYGPISTRDDVKQDEASKEGNIKVILAKKTMPCLHLRLELT